MQVLAVVLPGDREQPAGRALHRIAHRVMAEDVAKAGLLLEDRAGQRDRQAHAPGLAHHGRFEAPAVAPDGARDGIAARRLLAVAVGDVGVLVGEVMAQALCVRGPVGLCPRELLGRALLGGPDDQPEGAYVARRLEAEHPAHAPEGARGVLAPFPVDLQALVRPDAGQMRVETGLQVCDVSTQPPHFIELPHVRIRASRRNWGAKLRDLWRFCPGGRPQPETFAGQSSRASPIVRASEALQKLPVSARRPRSANIRRAAHRDLGALAS
jgi:hypothetical protein